MLPRPLVAVVLGSLVALALSAQVAAAERRVALVLGNSGYKAAGLELVNPRTDAEDVAAALKVLGFEVLVEPDADKATTDRAIEAFARKATGADTALFYYAGHALQYEGRNYLLPIDADVRDEFSLQFATVSVDTIRKLLERVDGVKIMVLDACRNNPVAGHLAREHAAATFAATGGPRVRGIERIDKAQGLIVAYAASPDAIALDGQGRNSPFTTAFLRRLGEAGLEVEMMFRKIAADVAAATQGRQRPETFVAMVSEYYLNRNDRIAWEQIEGRDDAAALRDFIERFPSSFYALEARYKLQALERAVAHEAQRRDEERLAAARRSCEADQAQLAAVADDDEAALRGLASTASCAGVRQEAVRRADAAASARVAKMEACRREVEQIEKLAQKAGPEAIADLRQRATCPAAIAWLDRRAAEVAAAIDAACSRDRAALGKVAPRDVAALRDLARKTLCPQVAADADRRAAEVEARIALETERCRRDEAEWRLLSASTNPGDIAALRPRVACEWVITAIDARLGALNDLCRRDEAALGAISPRDADSLRKLVGAAACDAVKAEARQRLAELDGVLVAEKETCRRDEADLAATSPRDADSLRKLVGAAACDAVKAEARQRLAELDGILVAEKLAAEKVAAERLVAEKEACRRDEAALAAMSPRDADALRSFVVSAACDAVKVEAQQRLAKLDGVLAAEKLAAERLVAEKEACRRDEAALAAMSPRDADALRRFVASAACDAVKAEARQRLAKLDGVLVAEKEACRRDEAAWADIVGTADRVLAEAFRKKVACPAVLARVDAALAELRAAPKPEPVNTVVQVRAAQRELARLGCFKGQPDGMLDRKTEKGLKRYFLARGAPIESGAEIRINNAVVAELKQQDKDVCAAPVVARPEPEPAAPESKVKPIARRPPKLEPPEPKQAREKPAKPVAVIRDVPGRPPAAPSSRPTRREPAPVAVGGNSVPTSGGGRGSSMTGVGF